MSYPIGTRLWVKAGEHPWWPARVALAELHGVELEPPHDTFVIYYGTNDGDTISASDTTRVAPFDLAPEKTEVEVEGLADAIQLAVTDDTALGGMLEEARNDAAAAAAAAAVSSPLGGGYVAGHLVWLNWSEKRTWWPAKVMARLGGSGGGSGSAAVADLEVAPYPLESGVVVRVASTNTGAVVPFELRSEKAATGDPAKVAAIAAAQGDRDALECDVGVGAVAAAAAAAGEREKRGRDGVDAARKKSRAENARAGKGGKSRAGEGEDAVAAGPDAAAGAAYTSHASDNDLMTTRHRLHEAAAREDVAGVRSILIDLVDVNVTLSQLHVTKIGVEVGNVLGRPALRHLHPLASAIVNKWAGQLPRETRDLLVRRLNARHNREKEEAAATAAAAAAATPSGSGSAARLQLQPHPQSLPTLPEESAASPLAAPATPAGGAQGQGPRPTSFTELIAGALGAEAAVAAAGASGEHVREVAAAIARACTDKHRRMMLLKFLEHADHHSLRVDLLRGTVTAAELVRRDASQFRTAAEIAEEKERLEAHIRLRDETEASMEMQSEMFECPDCNGRKTSFYEMQIRSADEPTTKFIRCLNPTCKKRWSTE